MYIQCTNTYIQIEMQVSLFIPCSDKVFTRTHCILIHVSVHTCLELVHTLYILSTYIECTNQSVYVHVLAKSQLCPELSAQVIQPP